MIPIGYNVWEMYGKSLLFSPRNVHFTLSKMTIANQTQLTSICFGCDRAALSASSLVGELSVTLRDLPHTLFGSLASNAAPIRYNLRIVTDIAIAGPRTLVTAGAWPYGTPRAVGTVGVPVHATKRAYVTTPMIKGG